MNANEVKRGDVVHKPPFWPNPMHVVCTWTDGDGIYADVADDDERVNPIPMRLSPNSHGRGLCKEIVKIIRNTEVIYEREGKEEAV